MRKLIIILFVLVSPILALAGGLSSDNPSLRLSWSNTVQQDTL